MRSRTISRSARATAATVLPAAPTRRVRVFYLDVGERAAVRLPGPHVLGAQLTGERLHLTLTEGHHLVLTEIVRGGFPRTATAMSRPLVSAEINPMRSSLAGWGFQ